MFELLAKLGSQNYKELMKIVDSQINHDCLDSIEKIAIIKLLERLFSLSEGSSLKAELFILIAQTAFHSDSLSTIRQRVDVMTIENAAKILCNIRPLQQIYVKSLFMTFRDIDKQNSNEKLYMDAVFDMLSLK
jgi:hypothetical protein